MKIIIEIILASLCGVLVAFYIVGFIFIFTYEEEKELVFKSEYKNLQPFKYEVDINLKDTTYFYKIKYN